MEQRFCLSRVVSTAAMKPTKSAEAIASTYLLFKSARLLAQLRPTSAGRRHTKNKDGRDCKAAATLLERLASWVGRTRPGYAMQCQDARPCPVLVAGENWKRAPDTLDCRIRRQHQKLSADDTRDPIYTTGHTNKQSKWYVYALNHGFWKSVASRSFGVAGNGGVRRLHPPTSAAAANS